MEETGRKETRVLASASSEDYTEFEEKSTPEVHATAADEATEYTVAEEDLVTPLSASFADTPVSDAADHHAEGVKEQLHNAEITVDKFTKNKFLDSVAYNTSFEHTYQLYSGKMSVTYTSIPQKHDEALVSVLRAVASDKTTTTYEYGDLIRDAMLYLYTKSINGLALDKTVEITPATLGESGLVIPDWVYHARKVIGANFSTALIGAAYQKLTDFQYLYGALIKMADDVDFWNAEDSTIP